METSNRRSKIGLGRVGVTAGLVTLLIGLAAGCTSSGDKASDPTTSEVKKDPVVSDVWARAATAGSNTAIYMSIKGGSSDDELTGVATDEPLADKLEIHETKLVEPDDSDKSDAPDGTDDKMMGSTTESTAMGSGAMGSGDNGGKMKTMQRVDKIEIPAGESVELAPGGYHVMFTNLHRDFKVGESVEVTLTFENAGEIKVTAEVRES